jgi:hypothetical protein
MNLLEKLRGRGERNARKREERAKALRERQRGGSSPEDVADAVKGFGFSAWGAKSSSADSPDRKKARS